MSRPPRYPDPHRPRLRPGLGPRFRRRLAAALVAALALGGAAAVTQVSFAGSADPACEPAAAAAARHAGHRHPPTRSAPPTPTLAPTGSAPAGCGPATPTAATGGTPGPGDRSDVLGTGCEASRLTPHDGFQNAPRCVGTEFGEVAAADRSPSLLITGAPPRVRANRPFVLRVSTRNLVRDRFLPAAAGGYFAESSFLTAGGLQRGHFHTACRMLPSLRRAPDPAPAPAFFKATEDGGGGARPDTVTVEVPGLPTPGVAQCAVWAGDGSHRLPMMQRANQTPAFDAVRIVVTR